MAPLSKSEVDETVARLELQIQSTDYRSKLRYIQDEKINLKEQYNNAGLKFPKRKLTELPQIKARLTNQGFIRDPNNHTLEHLRNLWGKPSWGRALCSAKFNTIVNDTEIGNRCYYNPELGTTYINYNSAAVSQDIMHHADQGFREHLLWLNDSKPDLDVEILSGFKGETPEMVYEHKDYPQLRRTLFAWRRNINEDPNGVRTQKTVCLYRNTHKLKMIAENLDEFNRIVENLCLNGPRRKLYKLLSRIHGWDGVPKIGTKEFTIGFVELFIYNCKALGDKGQGNRGGDGYAEPGGVLYGEGQDRHWSTALKHLLQCYYGTMHQ